MVLYMVLCPTHHLVHLAWHRQPGWQAGRPPAWRVGTSILKQGYASRAAQLPCSHVRCRFSVSQIKQNVLLKYKYMVAFLKQNGKDIFTEVRPSQSPPSSSLASLAAAAVYAREAA